MTQEMFNKLKALVGKPVSFFDETGGCVSIRLKYIQDWWNQDNDFFLTKITDKLILVHPLGNANSVFKIKIDVISEIENNDLHFFSKYVDYKL
jgi:hypothetical protein